MMPRILSTNSQLEIKILISSDWMDYELLDSGNGSKLERYGTYTFIRPAPQAIWMPALPSDSWKCADGVFEPARSESGGCWNFNKPLQGKSWQMQYKRLRFKVQASASRHMGVFPEQAPHWDWIGEQVATANRPIQVLNLFGYTGLATLAAAQAGGRVTHVDAAKKSVRIARENQALSNLEYHPIRWIVDDTLKFVRREAKRNVKYEGIILDPPKFGRGPKGEVWEFFDLMPRLLEACREVLSRQPLFVVNTAYAIQASPTSLYYSLQELMRGFNGETTCGELALKDSAGRLLSMAIYARWEAQRVSE